MPQHGHFAWNELNTHDPDAAKRFYTTAIGWTFEPMPMADGGTYWVAKIGDSLVGGLFTMAGPAFEGIPEHWLGYVEVDDVDRRTSGAVDAGGSVIRQPWQVPGVGRIAILRTPGGAVQGWMTSDRPV